LSIYIRGNEIPYSLYKKGEKHFITFYYMRLGKFLVFIGHIPWSSNHNRPFMAFVGRWHVWGQFEN
jgi:hypothetical protein